jgi:EAL domain-containing protein (putative c-di-GMP-specific phosphodiesterase class I)
LEVYIGVELPEDVLAKSIAYFRKYGVSVIWDHFGIKACNLKNLMDMPFSGVKISHQLVARFCSEKSMQLIYLIRMFKKKGWIVCLDGVGCQEDFKLVTKMNVDYVQGEKIIEFIPEDSIEKFLSELAEGGSLNDI